MYYAVIYRSKWACVTVDERECARARDEVYTHTHTELKVLVGGSLRRFRRLWF